MPSSAVTVLGRNVRQRSNPRHRSGSVHLDSALSAEERAAGKTLLCCAEPEGDIELTYEPQENAVLIPSWVHEARVTRMNRYPMMSYVCAWF